ncbi:class I SAM-dependent methyltransferase, partial [Halobacteriales archaeon SW_7_68_16]
TPTAAFADENPESYEKRSTYPTFLCLKASLPET